MIFRSRARQARAGPDVCRGHCRGGGSACSGHRSHGGAGIRVAAHRRCGQRGASSRQNDLGGSGHAGSCGGGAILRRPIRLDLQVHPRGQIRVMPSRCSATIRSAGLVQRPLPAGENRQSAWLTFLAVRDVDAVLKTALRDGATSLAGAKSYAGRGRQAVLRDPDGAAFAILASSSGDTPDLSRGARRVDLERFVDPGSGPQRRFLSDPVRLRRVRRAER